MIRSIRKRLSPNDLGFTGSHQAGILVPKQDDILGFFPRLDRGVKNPRADVVVHELKSNERWTFRFIYYNNKQFGGTRNEFRLTCMTRFLAASNASVGDELVFGLDKNHSYTIDLERESSSSDEDSGSIVISGDWKIISNR